jgi:hypothetical protein
LIKHLLVAASVFLTAAAHAQTETPPADSGRSPTVPASPYPAQPQAQMSPSRLALEQGRAALAQGNFPAAAGFLAMVDETQVDINDLDFLRGTLAFETKKYREAAQIFDRILARDARLNRVRLELARARYFAGDEAEAERQFRAAIAAGVPLTVARNISGFLVEIRRRRHWDFDFGAGIASDTNINVATSAQQIEVFGLPFQVDSPPPTSGLGLALSGSGNYQFDITDDTRLKVGGAFATSEYRRDEFSDRQVALYAGPRFLLNNNTEFSILATANHRWFGGKNFTESHGVRVEGEKPLTERLLLNATVAWQNQTYLLNQYSYFSGPIYSANTIFTYAQQSGFLRGIAGIVRENTRIGSFSDTQYILGAGIYRHTLPLRFSAYLSTQVAIAAYDDPMPAFSRTRHDTQIDTRLSISNAKLSFGRFTPIVSYIHTERLSNIAVYAYSRDRVEVGFSWVF